MDFFREGSPQSVIDESRAGQLVDALLHQLAQRGPLRRVLLLPPDVIVVSTRGVLDLATSIIYTATGDGGTALGIAATDLLHLSRAIEVRLPGGLLELLHRSRIRHVEHPHQVVGRLARHAILFRAPSLRGRLIQLPHQPVRHGDLIRRAYWVLFARS